MRRNEFVVATVGQIVILNPECSNVERILHSELAQARIEIEIAQDESTLEPALAAFHHALDRLSAFVLNGSIPEDLKSGRHL